MRFNIFIFLSCIWLITGCNNNVTIKNQELDLPASWLKQGNHKFEIIANGIIKVDENPFVKTRNYPSADTIFYFLRKIQESNFTSMIVNLNPSTKNVKTDAYYYNFFSALDRINNESNIQQLNTLIYEPRIREITSSSMYDLITELYNRNHVMGFYVDEPFEKEFEKLSQVSAMFNDTSNSWLSDKLFYVNLFGMNAIKNYEDYVDNWIYNGKPRLLSFDHYVVWNDILASKYNEEISYDWHYDFFTNLEIFRKKSIEFNIPFWTWVLVHKHYSTYSKRFYRRAESSDLSLQIFSSIAYGAKGILYYNFWNPHTVLNNNGWNEEYGLLDFDGKETELFLAAKEINLKAKTMGNILLDCENVGVYHKSEINFSRDINENLIPKTYEIVFSDNDKNRLNKYGIKLLGWNDSSLLSQKEIENKIIYDIDNPFAIASIFTTHLENKKIYYVLIVNKNRKGVEDFTISLKKDFVNEKLEVIDVLGNNIVNVNDGKFHIRINKGDAVLLSFKKL